MPFPDLGPPRIPTVGKGGKTTSQEEPIREVVGTKDINLGPYGSPRPGDRAPHEDAGELLDDFVGDIQGVGENIMRALDTPFNMLGFTGPHRLLDAGADFSSGIGRDVVGRITRFGRHVGGR